LPIKRGEAHFPDCCRNSSPIIEIATNRSARTCVSSMKQSVAPEQEGLLRSLVILMIEEEQPEGLSSRKLVVETVKHNVLTAYNAKDGIDLLTRFSNVDAVLVHAGLLHRKPDLLSEIRKLCHDKPIVLASPFAEESNPEANFVVDSHKPQSLVKLLAEDLQS